MKTNLIEGNKLIAEFMKWEKGENYSNQFEFYCVWDEETDQRTPEEMRFNVSWDWLMPVVEKCFSVYDRIEDNSSNHQFKLNDALIEININSLYGVVIEFIEWYNLNK